MIPGLTPEEVCELALKHRLYVSGWYLHFAFRNPWSVLHAALFYEDGQPVGVGVITKEYDIQIFVRAAYRRRGIGTNLVQSLMPRMGDYASRVDAGRGNKASVKFWQKNNIKRWDVD